MNRSIGDFSVLLSVYFKENPDYLQESLDSIINQSLRPMQVVIVKDGLLGIKLERILCSFYQKNRDYVKINFVELNKQENLGVALNAGLKVCTQTYVARMDSDDHAMKDRFSLQMSYMKKYPETKVLGGQIQEFHECWNHPSSYRVVPVDKQKIYKFARRRNPINHMTVMFSRKYICEKMRGYKNLKGFEDYELWLRVLKEKDGVVANVPAVLVSARVSSLQTRRGGIEYLKSNIKARSFFYHAHLISFTSFLATIFIGTLVSLVPERLRTLVYKVGLRKEI